ncbi:MAG: gliding motility-associated C-terminal domain-containing protein [Ferruginibacter sp.]
MGGTGNWTDLNHWATSSGGSVLHTQIPTALDDVFFDANSFNAPGQTITLNAGSCLARNMTWTGALNTPTLAGANSSQLKLYGSLTFIAAMNLTYTGTVSFEATTPGQSITSAGKTFRNTVTLSGVGGSWTLADAFSASAILSLDNGTFNSNNQPVTATQFISVSGALRTLNMGSSVFTLTAQAGWNAYPSTGFTLNSGTSVINLPAGNASFAGGDLVYYDLTLNAGGGISGNNSFHNVVFGSDGSVLDNNSFNSLTFSRNGILYGNNNFGNLVCTAGYDYVLKDGMTQTIVGNFSANGNCGSLITLKSSIAGNQASISHPPGAVTVSYLVLKDIAATGGAVFTANNAVDLGNNSGWTINSNPPRDLYWIGNAGNWNDGSHWSLTSGGPPSGCAPSPIDNVFFDANSFSIAAQSVAINIPVAYCRHMNWSGVTNTPSLNGPAANKLKIYGSLTFSAGMTQAFTGNVGFEATTAGQTITSMGKSFNTDVNFNGAGGSWTLQDAFACNGSLFLDDGTLTTNNNTVTASQFYSSGLGTRTLNMGSSVFNLNGGTCWNVSGLTLNCGTSVINALASTSIIHGGGLTYYDLNFSGNGEIYDNNTFHNVNVAGDASISNNNTFNNVVLSKKGTVYGSNIFSNLTLTAGFTYSFRNGETQTVNNTLNATGTCGALITLNSLVPGSQTGISHPPGAVTVSYVTLQDIQATGGALFTANNAIDLGNNSGWTINASAPRNLYWIGNSGNWNDGNHWSLTSGGAPSGCSPSPVDNVFFDANSFSLAGQTTTINIATAYCRDMNWTGVTNNPTLGGTFTSQLKIYGSLTLAAAMSQFFQGQVFFESDAPGNTITSSGKSFLNAVTFNGSGGSWTLQDPLTCTNTLFLNNGTLNSNNQPVTASTFNSSGTAPRTLNMGASVFTLTSPTFWNVNTSAGLTLNSGTSLINSTVNGNTAASFLGGGLAYYDLNFSGATTQQGAIFDNNSFRHVNFASNGVLYGSNTMINAVFNKNGVMEENNQFTNLTFTPNYTYTLRENKTQTITNRWQVQGSCVSYIILQSATPGSFATVTKPSGTVTGFNIHLRDIHATGGASFMAYNSVDLGGNSGWNFSTLPPLADPAAIIGPTAVCTGQSGVVYYIPPTPGAIAYNWTVPPGATITAIQGDTLIVVDFTGASSGNVTVTGFSGCAFSNPSTLAVTISATLVPAVSITASTTNSCAGANVSFTATPTNGGSSPNYQWQVNGINAGTNAPLFNTNTLLNGDIVTVILTSGLPCAAPVSATSNPITISISAPVTPAVAINAIPGNNICSGTLVDFTATASNTGGGTVLYDFSVNGVSMQNGAANTYSNAALNNGEVVTCTIAITGGTCLTASTAISNTISMTVTSVVTPAVTIGVSPASTICTGTTANFTATPIHGGTAPSYQWKLNGVNVGFNSPVYTNASLVSGDIVTVVLTSNAACASSPTAASNSISMTVINPVVPAVNIVASATSICSGTPVTFTATPLNGGSAPVYQWMINGLNAGTNTPVFTNSTLVNGDQVRVRMQSNAACATPATVLSNTIAIAVIVPLPVSVNITASANPICQGSDAVFTAIPVNSSPNPSYQWQVNGINTGANSSTYSSNQLADGDRITCVLNSSNTCLVPVQVFSNTIGMAVKPNPVISFNPATPAILSGNSVQLNAIVNGTVSSYLWTPSTGLNNPFIPNPRANPAITTTYKLKVVSTDNCVTEKELLVKVSLDIYIPNSFTPDGDGLNDVFRVPPGTSLTLNVFSVFDRYGKEVFRTHNVHEGWNGTYKGASCPAGTYTYIIRGSDLRRNVQLTGTVVLIR